MLLDGKAVGFLERNDPRNLTLGTVNPVGKETVVLDIIVHALGRVNFGCVWDFKGLVYPNITLNGTPLLSKSSN